ncbi:MarC family protein [Vineibacter terrae]|uniref:MarC family protein n=1 Tax=Vineibacter terrae TaxID=2586908 RepID=UPI002E3498C2|nr:MarC family protein [Vineibacter terrae]HEX2889113.1 MarC family protein [Vineibacter terrae]
MPHAATIISDLMIGYSTLISIINPFGIAFIFYDMTRRLSEAQRQALALRISLYSFSVLVVSSVLGSFILNFFGISVAALRIAGGLAVAFAGWGLLNKPDVDSTELGPSEAMNPAAIEAMAFYPLTMPLTTGPGTVAAAIALVVKGTFSADRIIGILTEVLIVAFAVSATIYVCYRWSGWLSAHLGVATTRILTRVSAFLLLCVGVQIIITGVIEVIQMAR